jgi:type III secretion system low calcium response chaperone LcrH/SycD
MDPLDQAFDTTMDKIHPEMKADQRTKFKDVMDKIFKEGMPAHEAMGLGNEMLENLYAYGNSLFSSGNYKKAQQVYLALCYLKPTEARFLFALAATYHKMKDYTDAIFTYVHSASLDKENPKPMFYLYDCFMQKQLFQSALESLIEAIKRCGDKKEHGPLKAKCLLIIRSLRKQVDEEEAKLKNQTAPEEAAIKPEAKQTANNTRAA